MKFLDRVKAASDVLFRTQAVEGKTDPVADAVKISIDRVKSAQQELHELVGALLSENERLRGSTGHATSRNPKPNR